VSSQHGVEFRTVGERYRLEMHTAEEKAKWIQAITVLQQSLFYNELTKIEPDLSSACLYFPFSQTNLFRKLTSYSSCSYQGF
jgi:hypothetical protein